MEDETPPQQDDTVLQVPDRTRVLLGRALIVLAVGLVVFSSPWLLDRQSSGDVRLWQDLLSVVAVLCVVPMAAVAWSSVSQPFPHDRTMLVLRRALDPAERKTVAAALRRSEPIHPAHRAYASAWVAQQRRGLVVPAAVTTAIIWSQALNISGREIGSGVFWLAALAAVGATAISVGALVLQLRRERSIQQI